MNRPRTSLFAHLGRILNLPLLSSELTQQAARSQTYVLRTGYAIVLYVSAQFWAIATIHNTGALVQLGEGAHLLQLLVTLQFFGVYLFMPVLTCGVIPAERERRTLDLLLLTPLGLTRILLEKLLSRLLPMGTFFLLTLPLLVFAFSLGGVEVRDIGLAVWFLSLSAVQVGCLSLICSARCQRSATALIVTWLVELLLFGPWAWHWLDAPIAGIWSGDYPLFPPAIYAMALEHPEFDPAFIFASLPTLAASAFCFGVARAVLEFAAVPTEIKARVWRPLSWLCPQEAIRPADDLPGEKPIEWLERRHSLPVLGNVPGIWLADLLLIVVCLAIGAHDRPYSGISQFGFLMWCMWAFSVLVVTVKGASLFTVERSRQTLDVLLSTPLTAREIVLQKFEGVYRWVQPLWIPFATGVLLSGGMRFRSDGEFPVCEYVICSLLTFGIYLPLCGWFGCWIGLHAKNQLRAVVKSLAFLVGWCVLPVVPALAFGPLGLILSPMIVPLLNETGSLWELMGPPASGLSGAELRRWGFVPLILNAILYGYCLAAIRNQCLRDAPVGLGRRNEKEKITAPP